MTERRRSPRFADTRALVRIALADGWTQGEIARKCRTVQSTVSRWASGQSLGSEQQLAPLIEQYGSRLNRNAGAVYRVVEARACAWEESPEARQLAELCAPAPAPEPPARSEAPTDDEPYDVLEGSDAPSTLEEYQRERRNSHAREERLASLLETRLHHEWSTTPEALERVLRDAYAHARTRLVRIDGPVLFRHTFEAPKGEVRRNAHGRAIPTLKMRPARRWIVHRAGRRHVRLVRLRIAELHGLNRVRWLIEAHAAMGVRADPFEGDPARRGSPETGREHETKPDLPTGELFSREDAGRWVARIEGPFEIDALLARCDTLVSEDGSPHDEAVVPFLLRKALLDHGYDVDGIERLGPVAGSAQ